MYEHETRSTFGLAFLLCLLALLCLVRKLALPNRLSLSRFGWLVDPIYACHAIIIDG